MSGRRITRDEEIRALLEEIGSIAVVGLSPKPHRDSHSVARYLQRAGYRIVPVRPGVDQLLGEPAHATLADARAAGPLDLVDVFRRPEALPALVEDAVEAGVRRLWFQLGVTHPEAEARALDAGIDLVVDRCLLVEHRRLMG